MQGLSSYIKTSVLLFRFGYRISLSLSLSSDRFIIQSMDDFREKLKDRFLKYVSFNTMSDPELVGKRRPTTAGQEEALLYIKKELEGMGLSTYLGSEWVLFATLEGNSEMRKISFMAHVDVSSDVCGNNVKAIVHKYDGGNITLPSGEEICDEELAKYAGSEIITSDGSTLLGGDDKAGCAILVTAAEILSQRDRLSHPTITFIFTPDEETGSGLLFFPSSLMDSSVCYTFDGGKENVVEIECFNAATVEIALKGHTVHLGDARGKMKSALLAACKIVASIPDSESPAASDGHYGYYAPLEMEGNAESALLRVFVRDFDEEKLKERVSFLSSLATGISRISQVELKFSVSYMYKNMLEVNRKDPLVLESLSAAALSRGVTLEYSPIRGGTDGARIAELYGIPSPNIFTGSYAFHSLAEWVSLSAMTASFEYLLSLVEFWSK